MALLNSYQNTFAAYSLRKTYSSYSGPLIRLYRDFDASEADVFADQNGEVSFDSPISVGKQSSSAVVLGEFVGKSGYRNPDNLPILFLGRISKIYDQSINANHFLVSTVSKMPLLFDVSGTEEIYKINDAPAYFVSQGMNNTLNEGIQLPDVGVEFSIYMSARSSSAAPAAFGFSVHDTSNFIIFPNISFFYGSKIISSSPLYYVLNNVRYNTRQSDIYSPTQYKLPVVPSDGVYLFSLNVVRPDTNENQLFPETQKVTPWNGHIYSDIIIYEGYDPQRDYSVESFMADEFQAVATKALIEESTESGFLTQFPNAAAAYSVRSLTGLTQQDGPKILRVRRSIDNVEVDVYTDSTGFVSLNSPIANTNEQTSNVSTGYPEDTACSLLGEFVNNSNYNNRDGLSATASATVVAWYDQSYVESTSLPLEISSDAAAAYSVRKVNPNYDGPLLKIRRDSDGETKDIYATASGDLDIDSINDFVQAGVVGEDFDDETLLLDLAPEAAAAYSLRKLRAGYTGPLVRVRRQDAVEVDVYPQADGWIGLDSEIEEVVELGGEAGDSDAFLFRDFARGSDVTVCVWYDQAHAYNPSWYAGAGDQNNATQETAGGQGKIYDSVNGIIKTTSNTPASSIGNYSLTSFINIQASESEELGIIIVNQGGSESNLGDELCGHNSVNFIRYDSAEGKYQIRYSNDADTGNSNLSITSSIPSGSISSGYIYSSDGVLNKRSGDNIVAGGGFSSLGTNSFKISKLGLSYSNNHTAESDDLISELIIYETGISSSIDNIDKNINNSFHIYGGWGATVETWYDQSTDTNYDALLDTTYGEGAAAAYSLRKLSDSSTNLVTVRRESDFVEVNVEADSNGEISLDSTISDVAEITDPYLLDSYSGAAAAYSLRKLSASYTGSAIAVRKDGDPAGNPHDIGFDVDGNLDVAELAAYCGSSDGFVEIWYDQANSNDATQSNPDNQPKIYDGASNEVVTENGKPAISSFGTNVLTLTTSLNTSTLHTNDSFAVGIVGTGVSNANSSIGHTNGSNLNYFNYYAGTTYFDSPTRNASSVSAYDNVQAVYFANRNGTTSKTIHINSTGIQNTTDTANVVSETIAFGFRFRYEVYTQEAIWWSDEQSSNRTGIEKNINKYYNIYSQLDGTDAATLGEFVAATGYDNPDSITVNDSAKVVKWWDQSSNGNHATQEVANSQPTLVNAGVLVTENGKPVISFVNDFLVSNSWMTAASPVSLFLSYRHKTSGTIRNLLLGVNTANPFTTSLQAWNDNGFRTNSMPADQDFGIIPVNGSDYLVSVAASTTQMSSYINGSQTPVGTTSHSNTSAVTDAITIGSPTNYNPLTASVYEFIAYLSDQNGAGNRPDIEKNINSYYRIYDFNDATQSEPLNQPAIYNSQGVITENGRGAIQFIDDLSHHLITQTYAVEISQNPASVFAVASAASGNWNYMLAEGDALPPNYSSSFILGGPTGTDILWVNSDTFGSTTSGRNSLGFDYNGSNQYSVYLNGPTAVDSGTASIVGPETSIGTYIGSRADGDSPYFNGLIQEIITYKSNQGSTGNRPDIEKSINSYYNIYIDNGATQTVSTSQPTLVSNGELIVENGKAAILGNGTTTKLTNFSVSLTGDYLISLVSKLNAYGKTMWLGTTSLFQGYFRARDEGNAVWIRHNGEIGGADFNVSVPLIQLLHTAQRVSTTMHYAQNGVDNTTTERDTQGATFDINCLFDGYGDQYEIDGTMQEVVIYASNQSENRSDIENNINNAYSIYSAAFPSVLDKVPNAAAAYSVRRLTKEYKGPLITVAGKDFYPDFWGNLNAQAVVDHATAEGNYNITKWWDQSGKGNHLESTANHPTLNISSGGVTGVTVNSTNGFDTAQIITDMNAVTTGSKQLIAVTSTIDDTIDLNTTSYTDLKEIIYYT